MSKLPEFAHAWMAQWRSAGPALEKQRNLELAALTESQARQATFSVLPVAQYSTGLIAQQAWFMRKRVLDSLKARTGT